MIADGIIVVLGGLSGLITYLWARREGYSVAPSAAAAVPAAIAWPMALTAAAIAALGTLEWFDA